MKKVTQMEKKIKKKSSWLVVLVFSFIGLGNVAGSCLSAMSKMDISLMIALLEVSGPGPRVETWHLPKSWRQWRLFLLPRMRNWSYLLALVHKGGLSSWKLLTRKQLGLTLRSGKIYKGLRRAVRSLLLLLSFVYRSIQVAIYATFSIRGNRRGELSCRSLL